LQQEVQTFASEEYSMLLVCKVSAMDKAPMTADAFYGEPLTIKQNELFNLTFNSI